MLIYRWNQSRHASFTSFAVWKNRKGALA